MIRWMLIYTSRLTTAAGLSCPRLSSGGIIVFDEHGFPSCPGARAAVDDFLADKPEIPLVLPTG